MFVGPVVLDKRVKVNDPSLNRSRALPPEAAGGGIFNFNFRPEVDNDAIPGVAVDNVGMDVFVKFDGSMSNGFRDIRGADFVSNEQDEAHSNSTKRLSGEIVISSSKGNILQ